jgi:hypothetical protein
MIQSKPTGPIHDAGKEIAAMAKEIRELIADARRDGYVDVEVGETVTLKIRIKLPQRG